MRKMVRSLLLLSIVTTLFAAPEAFGGKRGGGQIGQSDNKCGGIYFYCYYDEGEGCCYRSSGECYNSCVSTCGGPCDWY